MIDAKQARYADLIECCARSLAFDGLTEVALPKLVSELTSEAIDLRNGWADFSVSAGVGAADLPIVDTVIFEVLARASALRNDIVGDGRRVAPHDTGAFTSKGPRDTAHAVATQMREHLAALRTRQLWRWVGT
jgi:hypothetical protein